MGYLWRTVGDPLAFAHAERLWGRIFTLPPVTLVQAFLTLPHQPDRIVIVRGFVDLVTVLVILGALIWGFRRMRMGDWLYALAILVIALSYPTPVWVLLSNARLMLAAFPCLLFLAREGRRPWLNALILGTFTLLLVILTQYYLRGKVIV